MAFNPFSRDYEPYDLGLAYENAGKRKQNIAALGGGVNEQAAAFYSPNSTQAGDEIYHAPIDSAAPPSNFGQTAGGVNTIADAPEGSGIYEAANAPVDENVGGGGGFDPKVWDGITYTNAEDYKNAVDATIMERYNTQIKTINDMWNAGIIDAATKEKDIRGSRDGLVRSRDEALTGVKGYFSSISPNAIQSQQRTREDRVGAEFGRGNEQLGQALPESYYTGQGAEKRLRGDLTPEEIAPYQNRINSTGAAVRGVGQLGTNRQSDLASAGAEKQGYLDQSLQGLLDSDSGVTYDPATTTNIADIFNTAGTEATIAGINPYTNTAAATGATGAVARTSLTPEEIDESRPYAGYA